MLNFSHSTDTFMGSTMTIIHFSKDKINTVNEEN